MDQQTIVLCIAWTGAIAIWVLVFINYRSRKKMLKLTNMLLEQISIYKRRIAHLRDKYPEEFFLDDLLDEMTNNPDLKD